MNRHTLALLREQYKRKRLMASEQTEEEVKLINTNFQDNHGVVISGGNNEIHITIDKSGNMSATSKPKDRTVPKELQTEKARTLIMKFQQAGWLDEALQPINMSRPQMAVFAHSLADELGIKNMWTTFGDLWGAKALAVAYQEGMKQQGMSSFLDEFGEIIG